MNTFDEVTSNMETVLKKRPANDTTTGTNMSNTNMDENTNGDIFEGEKMVSLKHLKKAKIDRRSRGRSSNIHSRSGNSPEIPAEFNKKKMLKKISAQVTRVNSSDSHDSALSNVSGGSGALSSKYNKLQKKYQDLKNLRYTEPERILNSLKEKYEQRESNYKERIETWAARASELKSRLQQLEGHGEDYGQTNNVEQLKVKIKKLTSRLSKVEKERDDVLNTLNAQSHDFNSNNSDSNNNSNSGLGGLFRHMGNNNNNNNSKIQEEMKKTNRLYETLTSISIIYQENSDTFLCQGVDAKTNDILKFELSFGISEEDTNEMVMSYLPIQNVHSLPEHLQDEIEFNVVHAHNFFNTIFKHIKKCILLVYIYIYIYIF